VLKGEDRVDAMKLIEAGRNTQYVMNKFNVSRSTVDRNWKRWKSEKELSGDKKPKPQREAADEEIRA
jgi:transposase